MAAIYKNFPSTSEANHRIRADDQWKGNNSPQNIGLTIVGYLYRQGIEKRAMGYACAVGLVLLVIVMIVNMIQLAATGTFKKEER